MISDNKNPEKKFQAFTNDVKRQDEFYFTRDKTLLTTVSHYLLVT